MLALGGALLTAPAAQAEKIDGEKAAALRCHAIYAYLTQGLYIRSHKSYDAEMPKSASRRRELLAKTYGDKVSLLFTLIAGVPPILTQEEIDFGNRYVKQISEDDNLRIQTFRTCEKMFPLRLPTHQPLDLSDLLSLE